MRRALHVLVGALLLIAAAIVVAPASLLDRFLASRTDQRLRLADAQGLWWHGRGVLTSADGIARIPIAWRVPLPPLATGALAVDLEPGDEAMPSGMFRLRRGASDVRDLRLRAPAALIAAFAPALKAVTWGGDIVLHAPSLIWRDGTAAGALEANWHRARLATADITLDLGTVSIATTPGVGPFAATIRNTGGDVMLDGTVQDHAGVLNASLRMTPSSSAPEAVSRMLPLFGTSDGARSVHVTWRSDR